MKFVDSSVLVGAALEASPHFESSRRFLESRTPKTCVTSGHALIETYSTLTRLPAGHRLKPAQAHLVIANFGRILSIAVLDADELLRLIAVKAADGVVGGRIYDAVHARTAAVAGARAIVTWNGKHFEGLERGLAIETP